MSRLLILVMVLLLPGRSVRADPLDRRTIPAGATWFVHIDLDAARDSTIGKALHDVLLSQPDAARALDQARQMLNLDLTRDIRSITLYGTTFSPDNGVLMARGKLDHDRLEALLTTLPGYYSQTLEGHTLYFWIEAAPNRRHGSAGAFQGDDRVVVAPDGQTVLSTLDCLDGKAPGLAADSQLGGAIEPTAIFQCAAVGLAEAREVSAQSPIVRQCQSGAIALGEQDGVVWMHGHVNTQSPDTASQLLRLIQGAQALAQLQAADNVEMVNLLRQLVAATKDNAVEVHWQYSAVDLVKIARDQAVRRAAATQPGKPQ